MSVAVVDASVVVRWFMQQNLSKQAEYAFRQYDLTAPSLILAEIGNALWKYYRAGALGKEKLLEAFEGLETTYFSTAPLDGEFSRSAVAIAVKLSHPIYDCYYLALSELLEAPLITDDQKLARAAEGGGYDIIRLSDLPEHHP